MEARATTAISPLRIGLAGLDTSHVPAFARMLHAESDPYHVPGARIAAAYPGGSSDFELSIGRVDGFTNELREKYQVPIVEDIGQLEGLCDVVFLESIDGRVHPEQFRQVATWGVPVFIDKPFAIASAEARKMVDVAGKKGVRAFSASALRYAERFREALAESEKSTIVGGDFFGPIQLQSKSPGYYWYGIHSVEMLYAAFGPGCREVRAVRDGDYDLIVGQWADGRLGTIRGNRTGNNVFGGCLHRKSGSRSFQISGTDKPYYASLLEEILAFAQGEAQGVPLTETMEIIRFLEAANESLIANQAIQL